LRTDKDKKIEKNRISSLIFFLQNEARKRIQKRTNSLR